MRDLSEVEGVERSGEISPLKGEDHLQKRRGESETMSQARDIRSFFGGKPAGAVVDLPVRLPQSARGRPYDVQKDFCLLIHREVAANCYYV